MQRLLAFIEHNFHFILFIILQIICGFLIFGLNPYQQAVFSHSAASVTARSNQFSNDLTSYIDLKEQNILLQSQVSEQFKNAPNNSFQFFIYLRIRFGLYVNNDHNQIYHQVHQ